MTPGTPQFLAECDALFANPTLEAATAYFRKQGHPPPAAPDVPLAAVHKARLQWLHATDAQLAESAAWLLAHGYETSTRGMPPLTPESRDAQLAALRAWNEGR